MKEPEINPEIFMDESEFAWTDKTDEELRTYLLIHPKVRDFHLRPRIEDE